MEQYLEYLGYDGIYTRLDKTEGPMKDLNNYIGRYKGNQSDMVEWDYDDMDINEMMLICFDYINHMESGFVQFCKASAYLRHESFFVSDSAWILIVTVLIYICGADPHYSRGMIPCFFPLLDHCFFPFREFCFINFSGSEFAVKV